MSKRAHPLAIASAFREMRGWEGGVLVYDCSQSAFMFASLGSRDRVCSPWSPARTSRLCGGPSVPILLSQSLDRRSVRVLALNPIWRTTGEAKHASVMEDIRAVCLKSSHKSHTLRRCSKPNPFFRPFQFFDQGRRMEDVLLPEFCHGHLRQYQGDFVKIHFFNRRAGAHDSAAVRTIHSRTPSIPPRRVTASTHGIRSRHPERH